MTLIKKITKKKFIPAFNLWLEGNDDPLVISMDLITKYKLGVGSYVENNELDKILSEQELINAKQAAYNYVSYKSRSEHQIKEKLSSKGFTQDLIEDAIQFLYEFNLLDDRKFARSFVKSKIELKKYGKGRLKIELLKKGINKEIIEDTLNEVYPEHDKYKMALELAEKKYRIIRNKPKNKIYTSIKYFLQRQGFDWEVTKKTLDALLKQED